jgi:predicted nucleic acid-binding protein
LVEEPETDELVSLYPDQDVVAWWGTEVECASALARLERCGELEIEEATTAFQRLRALARSWHLVEPTELVKESATRLLRTHDLRAADSLQLASALVAAEQRPASLELVCRDRRLALSAQREGFPVL